jgi:predicted nucleic acid-binding protein
MDAFDADVLIYAAVPGHRLGRRVRALFPEGAVEDAATPAGVGSTLLLAELLIKPTRDQADEEVIALTSLLARLDLRPVDEATAELAVALGAAYGLKSADAVHLATGVSVGADRFLTDNQRDFPRTIGEIDITYPDQLVDPEQ